MRRACVPVLAVGLLSMGLATPTAFAEEVTSPPAQADVRTSEAEAAAEAVATNKDVVVDAATTPTAMTVATPDGTLTTTISNEPVRMQTSEGWIDISTDLVPATVDGVAVLKPQNVPVDITVGAGGSNKIASLDDKDGHSLSQSWPFGTLPTPVVEGNSATYRQVLPGVDLIQLVHKTGISQVLKIETAEAAKDPRVAEMRIFLDTKNTVVEQGANGALTAKGTDSGEVELNNTGGLWWDSSAQGASATDPGGNGVPRPFSLSLGSEAGKQSQIFGMDEILGTTGLQFPVYVDPDWNAQRAKFVFVDTAYPETSYWMGNLTNGQMHVGYLRAVDSPQDLKDHLTRSYFQFDTSYLIGRDILTARLNTFETWSYSCTPAYVASWITGDITNDPAKGGPTRWNAQPPLYKQTDIGAVAKGYNASCPSGSVGFDLMAGKPWIQNMPVWNVMLAAGVESDPYGWKKFENTASITVTHNTAPYTPAITTISGGKWTGAPWTSTYTTRNKKPIFRVSAGDIDYEKDPDLTVFMTVRRYSDRAIMTANSGIPGKAWNDYFDWQSGIDLPDGKYILQAQARDPHYALSGIMEFTFEVDTTPPPAPTISSYAVAGKPGYVAGAPGFFETFDAEGRAVDEQGVIGETEYRFNLSIPATADPVEGFIFSITPGGTNSPYPQSIRCNDARIQEYVAVCPADGRSADITIAGLGDSTTLTAWAFDTAGNVSVPLHNANASTFTFRVGNGDPAVKPETFLPVTLSGQAAWATVNAPGTSCGNVPGNVGGTPQMLNLPNGTSFASTTERAVDTTKSWSVAGWFCPSSTTTIQDLIVQWAGTNVPAAALRLRPDGLPEVVAWKTDGSTEIAYGDETIPAGSWVYVAAIYDRINAQLRITKTTTNGTGIWIEAASPSAHRAAATNQPVRLGGPGFAGNIYKPMMTQGVMKPTDFTGAQVLYTSSTKGLQK